MPGLKRAPLSETGRYSLAGQAPQGAVREIAGKHQSCRRACLRHLKVSPEFLFVPAHQVLAVAECEGALPFDVPGVKLSHDGELWSFDTFLKEYQLADPALGMLAVIVRGADTARLELAPRAAGLLALSLGLSRIFAEDHEMLSHGMVMYDALYAWCRDCQSEALIGRLRDRPCHARCQCNLLDASSELASSRPCCFDHARSGLERRFPFGSWRPHFAAVPFGRHPRTCV
jgi:hypothetical protein